MPSDLFIAIPTTGTLTSTLAAFFVEARERGCEVQLFNNYTPIPHARNVIATRFLQTPCRRLWMIDSDMHPPGNVWGLLNTEADIVGGLYPRGAVLMVDDNKPTLDFCAYRYGDVNDTETIHRTFHPELGSGDVEVDAVGDGCKIIRREVLEDPRMRLAAIGANGVLPLWRSTFTDDWRYVLGNDIEMCLRARRLGYSVKVNTNVLFGHDKKFDLATVVKMIEVHRGRIPPEAVGLVSLQPQESAGQAQ